MPLHEGLFNAAFTLHQHGCLQWIHTPLVGLVGLVGDQGRCLRADDHLFGCLLVDQPGFIDPGYDQVVSSITNTCFMFVSWCGYICIIAVYIYRCTHIHTHLLNWGIKLTNTFRYGIKQLVPFGVISPGNS